MLATGRVGRGHRQRRCRPSAPPRQTRRRCQRGGACGAPAQRRRQRAPGSCHAARPAADGWRRAGRVAQTPPKTKTTTTTRRCCRPPPPPARRGLTAGGGSPLGDCATAPPPHRLGRARPTTVATPAGTAAARVGLRRPPLPRGEHRLDDRRRVGGWPVAAEERVHILPTRRRVHLHRRRGSDGGSGGAAPPFLRPTKLLNCRRCVHAGHRRRATRPHARR